MATFPIPDSLQANAWFGGTASSMLGDKWTGWSMRTHPAHEKGRIIQALYCEDPAHDSNWEHPDVGWGLIMADNDERTAQDKAVAADAPEAIRELLHSRPNSPVFRYRSEFNELYLQFYGTDGTTRPVKIAGSARGIGLNRLPKYLLIYGSPTTVPWRLQYVLEANSFVGRLDLPDAALGNYVSHLIDRWKDSEASRANPLIWSTDHGREDITWLMRQAIARPLIKSLEKDSETNTGFQSLSGENATVNRLISALEKRPAWIVTTSHGMIHSGDDDALEQQIGWLVDDTHDLLSPSAVLQSWQPDGAIWYSHACCSAGTDDATNYDGLLETESDAYQAVHRAASLGPRIAPLPSALLAAAKPLRAFIGHVQPTFNWTLRDPETLQVLTSPICTALYDNTYLKEPWPIGLALSAIHKQIGPLVSQWMNLKDDRPSSNREKRDNSPRRALHTKLACIDHQSCVLLGDPTAAFPAFRD